MANKGTSVDIAPAKNDATDAQVQAFNLEAHRVKMMLDEPFFAAVLRGVNYTRTESIPTAGVLAEESDVHMWWNPRFLASLTNRQVKGLLKHEAMHLALEHTTSRRLEPHTLTPLENMSHSPLCMSLSSKCLDILYSILLCVIRYAPGSLGCFLVAPSFTTGTGRTLLRGIS